MPDRKSKEPVDSAAAPVIDGLQPAEHAPSEAADRPVMSSIEPAAGQVRGTVSVADQSVQPTNTPAARKVVSDRVTVWAEGHDPTTASERLAEIAGQYPEFATAIVDHPNCYPALVEWARDSGLLSTGE